MVDIIKTEIKCQIHTTNKNEPHPNHQKHLSGMLLHHRCEAVRRKRSCLHREKLCGTRHF